MFIAPLSTTAKRWKQPKCPSGDKWISKMWFIYTMEYSSTLKRKVGFPCGSVVKNLPTNAGEDPLEKEMATHSSILAWEILWTEQPGRLQSMGYQTQLSTHAQNRKAILSHAIAWMDLVDTLLSEILVPKDKHSMIPLTWDTESSPIHRKRK